MVDVPGDILQENHYYPFGMSYEGPWLVNDGGLTDNPYQYNGKELHVDFGLGWYAYGARYYDAVLGRFTGVDPISDKFPHVTTYNYAENMPTIAIDLHGLQAVVVHGTTQTTHSFSRGALKELVRIAGNTSVDETFSWHAPLTNNMYTRNNAARGLVNHVLNVRSEMLASGTITENEGVSLIGYSHGGNVGIQAAQMLHDEHGIDVNLVTVSTPAYNGDALMHNEDPAQADGIANHINIVHENDNVASFLAIGSSDRTFDNETSRNVVIPNSEVKMSGKAIGVTPHTALPYHPDFDDFLKNIPALPTPSTPKN